VKRVLVLHLQETFDIAIPDTSTFESQVQVIEDATNRITSYEATYGPILVGTTSVDRLVSYINARNIVASAANNIGSYLRTCMDFPSRVNLITRLLQSTIRLRTEFDIPLAATINQLNQRIQSGR
jgi:hypothetical protein